MQNDNISLDHNGSIYQLISIAIDLSDALTCYADNSKSIYLDRGVSLARDWQNAFATYLAKEGY